MSAEKDEKGAGPSGVCESCQCRIVTVQRISTSQNEIAIVIKSHFTEQRKMALAEGSAVVAAACFVSHASQRTVLSAVQYCIVHRTLKFTQLGCSGAGWLWLARVLVISPL